MITDEGNDDQLKLLRAKAHLLGGDLSGWTGRGEVRWKWRYPPHASSLHFATPLAAYNDLVRFLNEGWSAEDASPYPRR